MLAATTQLTEREIERIQQTAAEGSKTWGYLALAAGLIALALAILFAVLIARPIRQLDQAIRQMGTADFTHAIEVNGPQDMRYLGQRLEWLRSRLHELEEQQNRFLRHVSHELKTPLTAVREGAELLRDRVGGELSPEQREIVRIVRENTLSLQKLIEDLLTYHQTRSMEPQTLGPVALVDVLRRVMREHKLAAFARMLTFDATLSPAIVVGDGDKIRAIIDNLMSNAIKYAPRSSPITVKLSVEGDFAVLDVIDEGPGIEPDERPRIFESFYQGKIAPGGRIKGSGLGLAIASEYALAHGGRIEVLDRADGARGARFRLWLPLAPGFGPESARGADGAGDVRGRSIAMRASGPCLTNVMLAVALVLAPASTLLRAEPLRPTVIAQVGPGTVPAPGTPEAAEPQAPAPAVSEDEQQTMALLLDLTRYSSESNDELRRELGAAIQALNRARTEPNRIRAAVLLTLPGAGPTDDARAIALLESVSGKTPGASPMKQLAAVLLAQINERVRGMAEERKKSAAAQEKLDQLRAVERSLLLERNRNAGGAGGGGGGGGTGR